MNLVPKIGSIGLPLGSTETEVIEAFGRPLRREEIPDIEHASVDTTRRSLLSYPGFSCVISPAYGVMGIGLSGFQIDQSTIMDMRVSSLNEDGLANLLHSIGGCPEIERDDDLGTCCMEDPDSGVIAYFDAGEIETIEISVPWKTPQTENKMHNKPAHTTAGNAPV